MPLCCVKLCSPFRSILAFWVLFLADPYLSDTTSCASTSAAVLVFQSLSDPNNYHEFCRLLARLKSNYQLGELVKVENYPEVIRLIANFTVTSLQVLCV